MPKQKISEFNSNPALNTDIDSINISEGCAPSGINDAIRELMAQLKDFQTGAVGDSFNGPIGTTTAAAGAFTTLSASGNVTLSGGTANGVAYLNGSKVLTSGSALVFDGTNLGIGTSSPDEVLTVLGNIHADGSGSGSGTFGPFVEIGRSNGPKLQATQEGVDNDIQGLAFFTKNSSVTADAPTERMRINSSGNVGLGTASPTSIFSKSLQIEGSSTAGLRLTSTTYTSGYDFAIGASGEAYVLNRNNAEIRFGTNNTERMRLDSSGNLGIGTSSPSQKLTIADGNALLTSTSSVDHYVAIETTATSSYSYVKGQGKNSAGTVRGWRIGYSHVTDTVNLTSTAAIDSATAIRLDSSGNLGLGVTPSAWYSANKAIDIGTRTALWSGGAGQPNLGYNCYVNTSGNFIYKASDIANYYSQDGAHKWFNAASGTAGNAITFTQAMTLDASGNLLVGDTTSGTVRLRVTNSVSDDVAVFKNSNATPYGVNSVFSAASPNNTASYFYTAVDSGPTTRFKVYSNGGIANYSANNANLSDQRVKTDIQNAGGYLAKICAIPVRTFKYKDQTDDLLNLGVIAQEVEAVAPELVDTTGFGETPEDGVPLKAIYQTDLQYALMKCIQELKAEFDAYKASHP